MNRLNLLSRLFANSSRWRKVAVWSSLLGTVAGAPALAQQPGPGSAMANGQMPPDQVFAQAAASDAFVMQPSPSGSVADRGSYSRDIGIGGTGAFARMGHIAGETVGRTQSITHFEVMPYAFVDNTMWFTDGRFYATNNGHVGGSGGAGVRQYLPNFNSVGGVSVFYDGDGTRAKTFQQVGLSLEYLSEWFDVRTNFYQGVGRKSADLGTSYIKGSEHFVDGVVVDGFNGNNPFNSIAFNTKTRQAAGTDGLDMLFTVPVPGAPAQSVNLEASAGWYHFVANGFNLDDATGYRLRVDADLLASVAHTFVEFTSDKVFNNNVIFGADLNYYHDVQKRPRIGHNQFNRMSEWVRRNYTVVAIEQSIVNPDELAINPLTSDPYTVEHVRHEVPANANFPNFPPPQGDGTSTKPFQTIALAQASNPDIVFVHAGSVFTNEPVSFTKDGQQILGEGVNHPIQVSNPISNNGTIIVPTVTNLTTLPILQDTAGTAVTFNHNNDTFAGFTINNTTGTAISADSISSATIRDVTINTATGNGLEFIDDTGTIKIQTVSTTGVNGTDLLVDGGSANINWFGGLIQNTFGRPVDIRNQTGGTINLAGDNASTPAAGFGGVTINSTSGQGIRIQDTSAAIVFGRSSDTATSTPGVTIANSFGRGVQIQNLGQAGSVSFLHGLEIDNANGIALDIENTFGAVTFVDDADLATDLLIMGRDTNTAIELRHINALSQISVLGDTVIGAVDSGNGAGSPAINFHDGSAGTVRFDGDISIGTVTNATGQDVAAVGTAINIGDANGVLINATGATFTANGNVTIQDNVVGPAIRIGGGTDFTDPNNPVVVLDPTTVTFGNASTPGTVLINPQINNGNNFVPGQALAVIDSSANVRFNSSVTVGDSEDRTITINSNTGNVSFGTVDVTNAAANLQVLPTFVDVQDNNTVSFGSLSITGDGGLALRGFNNTSFTTLAGTIIADNGPAIDLFNNSTLSATFTSVSANNYDPFPFAIRVVDNQTISADTNNVITNPNTLFRIVGTGALSSGGVIDPGTTTGDVFASRGAVFQNIQTVDLNFQEYDSTEGVAIFGLNVVDFTLNGSTLTTNAQGDGVNTNTNISTTADPLGFYQVLLRATQDIQDTDTYNWKFTNNLITDGTNNRIVTSDAMVQMEASNAATGAKLSLIMTDNQDTTALIPGFLSFRDGNNGAAVRIDWNGPIDAAILRNAFELSAGASNQTGLDIIQDGITFRNTVLFNQNTLVATGITDDNLRGVRMDMDGPTDLRILDNAVVNSLTGAITPGFTFAGTNATGFDLRLRTAGNTVVFDDNYLDFNNTGGTGLLFSLINASSVRIGDDTGTFTNFGNQIDLTDTNASFDRGIIFQTTFGTIGLSGTQNNVIRTVPVLGNGTFIPFQAPGSSVGQIRVNGILVP